MDYKFEGHTPGPWEWGYGTFDGGYIGVFLPKESPEPRTICRVSPDGKMDAQDKANAALIAAAPDLLRRVDKLEAQNAKLRDALKAVEWYTAATRACCCAAKCPCCLNLKVHGHDSDCRLAKAIAACEQTPTDTEGSDGKG